MLPMSLNLIKNGFTLKEKRSRLYPSEAMTNSDYADNIALLAYTPAQAESMLHSRKQAVGGIDLDINAIKT